MQTHRQDKQTCLSCLFVFTVCLNVMSIVYSVCSTDEENVQAKPVQYIPPPPPPMVPMSSITYRLPGMASACWYSAVFLSVVFILETSHHL